MLHPAGGAGAIASGNVVGDYNASQFPNRSMCRIIAD